MKGKQDLPHYAVAHSFFLLSWSHLAESVVVEDVVELADYTKGDLCKSDRIEEMEIYDEEIFDGFDKLENNKSEL